MKYQLQLLIFILLCLAGRLDASPLYDYGLYLKSHAVPAPERSTLYLDDNQPFSVKNDLTISFQIYIRANEADYGSILHLKTDKGQIIRFSFVAGEQNHAPALMLNDEIIIIDKPIELEKWINVSLNLRQKDNVIEIEYDKKKMSSTFPLQETNSVTITFGQMLGYQAEVAPVNLRDINIIQDGKLTREWKLWKHNDNLCYDEKEGAVARAVQPLWLIDNHIEWKTINKITTSSRVGIAFDARCALFYVVSPESVKVLDEDGRLKQETAVRGGYPAVEYPNHLLYDTLSNALVSYSLTENIISRFSFDDGKWSNEIRNTKEANNYNHAKAFNPADSSFYFFGGYGFYKYRNDLFRMKSGSEIMEQIKYDHPLYPRYSAAMAVVGDELYIFGGKGNKYGKQELSTHYYLGLYAINLKSKQSRTIWEKKDDNKETIMASSMYFEPADSSFYAVSTDNGGTLWKISMKSPVYTEVSKPINNRLDYQDCDFNLYYSPTHRKLFLVLDKILNNRTHDIKIYSINMPLVNEIDIRQSVDEMGSGKWWNLLYVIGVLAILGCGAWLFYRSRSKRQPIQSSAISKETLQSVTAPKVISENQEKVPPTMPEQENEPASKEIVHYYDRSRSSISLLGCFNVRDKEGNDITANFTPRLKHLLILLILYTEKNPNGILTSKTTGILWPDKEETAARNNRNVNLRKLRVLLESIGDVEVVTENNFMHIKWGENVFCDYREVLARIQQFKEKENSELLNRILELLLYGPLLPNTILDWLDDFKETYSSHSIDLLKDLFEIEKQRNHPDMILRLADIMFLHDPLNEEALAAKCAVFSAQGKKGIARNLYDRFCKEYRDSMGEDYKTPFADL